MKKIFLPFIFIVAAFELQAQFDIDTMAYLKNNPNIYSIIVKKKDDVIYKKYFNQYDSNSLFNDQSLTKSICSILVGIAIDKGYLSSVDEKLVSIFPEIKNDSDKRKQEITVRQIMNQASGLYHEDLQRLDLFLTLPDPSNQVLKAPMVADPGKEWHYNNAASHLLSVILTKITGMDTRNFAKKYLFGPMHIDKFEWAKMKDGYYDGSGLLSIRLRSADMVKIGSLLLNNGLYDHQQIVSSKWVQQLFTPKIFYRSDWGFDSSTYALCFYHTVYNGTEITYGMGWGGQFLVMIPSKKAVVVINENTADANAIKQSIAFIYRVFPEIFKQIN